MFVLNFRQPAGRRRLRYALALMLVIAGAGLLNADLVLRPATAALVRSAASGTVVAWGGNPEGQTTIPTGLTNVTTISAGGYHSLALKGDGTVVAWGRNVEGQTTVPTGLTNVTAIAAGYYHNLALKGDGAVVAWGRNNNGQTTVPVGLTNVTAIAAGYYHNLALKGDGTVVAWGRNDYGQTNVPIGLSNVKAIAGGELHSLALKGDGTIVAWGSNSYGLTTVPAGLSNVTAIATGVAHNLALKGDGTVVAWGSNGYGEATVPAGLSNVIAIAAGHSHSLALKGDGTVVAWGWNGFGQTTVPAGLSNVTAISAGAYHNLAFIVAATPTPTATATATPTATPTATATATTVPPPSLRIPSTAQTLTNANLSVPVLLSSNGRAIASVGFGLTYDTTCLAFDAATDANSDGLPDTISGLPTGFAPGVNYNATSNTLEVALYDDTPPISTFSDGALLTVQFTVKPTCITTDGSSRTVTLDFAASPAPSFGDPTGADVAGTATGATIPLRFNAAPTALALSNSSVAENLAAGATVGLFTTTDLDSGDSHTYTLVSGAGDSDNASFTISGNTLQTAALFDYETKSSYTLRVRTTDGGGLFFEQSFTLSVTDVDETISAVDDTVDPRVTVFLGGQAALIDVLTNDLGNGGVLQVASVTQPATGQGSVTNNTTHVSYTAPQANGNTTFTYQASDGTTTSNSATVSMSYVTNHTRGDCNGNGNVAAADFIGVVLEIFDATNTLYQGKPAWWLSHTGDYAGSPLGCDANNSRNGADQSSASVTAADIICSVLIFFGHPCGTGVQAADVTATAHLAVADVQARVGATTTLTVTLNTGGNAIVAATFALGLDPAVLHFDATDVDEDGVPDAITLNTPAGMSKSATWNPAAKRLEVAVFGMSLPLPTLTDGTLATVTIAVANDTTATITPLALDLVSFSDPDGNDLPATDQDGTLTITGNSVAPKALFLPLVVR